MKIYVIKKSIVKYYDHIPYFAQEDICSASRVKGKAIKKAKNILNKIVKNCRDPIISTSNKEKNLTEKNYFKKSNYVQITDGYSYDYDTDYVVEIITTKLN